MSIEFSPPELVHAALENPMNLRCDVLRDGGHVQTLRGYRADVLGATVDANNRSPRDQFQIALDDESPYNEDVIPLSSQLITYGDHVKGRKSNLPFVVEEIHTRWQRSTLVSVYERYKAQGGSLFEFATQLDLPIGDVEWLAKYEEAHVNPIVPSNQVGDSREEGARIVYTFAAHRKKLE